ncbi:MAG: delta-60 repeat domain-containing protein, partial [Flavobacteriales bacterium]
FICSGTCNQFDGQQVDKIFRVHADGSVDTTFRTGVYIGAAYDYLPLVDGRVYVGGNFRRTEAPTDTLKLVRFLQDGALDPTFNIPLFGLGGLPGPFGPVISRVYPWFGNLLVTGFFRTVNGQPRRGICLLDTTGALLPAFANSGVGPFVYQNFTYASIESVAYDTANAQLYICGAYSGYNDGLNNYPEQAFITRLNVQELGSGVGERTQQAGLQLWPNPSSAQVWLGYALPGHHGVVQLRIHDAQGRNTHTLQASGEEGQVLWDTRGTAPGVYTVELLHNGNVERTERLIIQP